MSKLFVSKELYQSMNIVTAIEAYKDIASVRIEDEDKHWILWFSDCRYGVTQTIQEFENYLIGLENYKI